MVYISYYKSPLGEMTMASDGEALIGLWFDGQKYDRKGIKGESQKEAILPVFLETKRWLTLYFQGKDPGFTPALRLQGSDFRKMVGQIMLTIPYGQHMTYGQIAAVVAEKMGKKRMSAQAVGGAVGHNPIALIVPCHRVLGADGSLTGYAGGLWIKERLLKMEGVLPILPE